MIKSRLFIYVVAALIIVFVVLSLTSQAQPVRGESLAQTWPSRTPTPQGGPQPTNTSQPPPTDDPGNPPPPTNPPGPTNTLAPGEPSPTPTGAATFVLQTPEGGYEATAQPCGIPPTVQARGSVNVRMGPGLDYDAIDSLIFLEVRPIIGRAAFATWWQIQLPGNEVGWVADQAVTVQGYTGAVPIAAPPALNGTTPTPGPTWEPTPNPSCTPVPTTTPTNTAEVESAAPAAQPVSNTNPTQPPEPTATEEPTATATVKSTATAAVSTPTSTVDPAGAEQTLPNDEGGSSSSASSWILFIGIGLVVIGAAAFILRSR